jgi:hypothetical protein
MFSLDAESAEDMPHVKHYAAAHAVVTLQACDMHTFVDVN